MSTKLVMVLAAILSLAGSICSAAAGPAFQKRCGWFSNPTPANASLFDRDGEWIIGVQGGHQADGDWPEFGARNWVKTNGNYGYGCACIDMQGDAASHEVIAIRKAAAKPLQSCRRDRALSKWMKMLR